MTSAEELIAHYAAVRRRLTYIPPKVQPKPIPVEPPKPMAKVIRMPRRTVRGTPTVDYIIARFSRFTGVTIAEIKGETRRQKVVQVRYAAIYWSARMTGRSSMEIGKKFRRDHSTILYAIREYPLMRANAKYGRKPRYLRKIR